jgi:hypothetical protein
LEVALGAYPALKRGIATRNGQVVNPALAEAFHI